MDDRVRQLQLRIRALHRGQPANRIRYPQELRAEIVAVAGAGHAAGRSINSLARALGVSGPTLTTWLRRPSRGQLRRVAVAPNSMIAMSAPVSPVLVTPHGFRVEGLDLAGLVTVLRSFA